MQKRLFAAGCYLLIALGLVHLLGHYGLATSAGDNATERQLLGLMRSYEQDMGAGFVRSVMDLLLGFSLTFSILPVGMGMGGLVVLRYGGGARDLLRAFSTVYAGIYGIMTVVAFRYWFLAPLLFLAAAFACFFGAVAFAERAAANDANR
jgi:hypothetical protein